MHGENNVKKVFLTVFFKVRFEGKLQAYGCLSTQRSGKDGEQPAPGRRKGHSNEDNVRRFNRRDSSQKPDRHWGNHREGAVPETGTIGAEGAGEGTVTGSQRPELPNGSFDPTGRESPTPIL